MDSTYSSRSSLDSALSWEDSSSEVNLNNAILMTTGDEILFADEHFYDTNVSLPSLNDDETENDVSVAISEKQTNYFSHLSECTDSTSLFSLPKSKNYRDNNDVNSSMQATNDFQLQRDADTEEEGHITNKHVPLKIILRRIFDEILRKCSSSAEQSNTACFYISSTNEPLLNNTSLTQKLDSKSEINNNEQTQESNDMIAISVESVEDSSKTDVLSAQNTSVSFLNNLIPKKLFSILEDSYESSGNSQLKDYSDWSGKHMGRLASFSLKKLKRKHYPSRRVFFTSDTYDSEADTSSNMSSDIETLSNEIIQTENYFQRND